MVQGSRLKVKGSQFQVSKYKFPNPTVSGLQSIVLNLQSKHNISGVKISAVPFSECAGGGAEWGKNTAFTFSPCPKAYWP